MIFRIKCLCFSSILPSTPAIMKRCGFLDLLCTHVSSLDMHYSSVHMSAPLERIG